MKGRDFYDAIHSFEDLIWHGVTEGKTPSDSEVIVEYKPENSSFSARFSIPISTIIDNTWDDLFAVITVKRPAFIMEHITRIVGYYSNLENWNRSKIAELADRHKGIYGLDPDRYSQIPLNTTPVVARFAAQPENVLAAA